MKWRTDKPTADRIVAQISKCSLHTGGYIVLELKQEPKPHYVDCNGVDVPEYAFIKWADLEEDETVTDCDELEEEIERYIAPIYADEIKSEPFTSIEECARHFAKWGAEHRDRFLNWIRDLIKKGIEKPEEALNILKRIDALINDDSL